MKKRIASLTLALLVILSTGCEDIINAVLLGGTEIPYSKLNLNMFPRNSTGGSMLSQMQDIRALGINSIRVTFWFDTLYMPFSNSSPDFSRFDDVISNASQAGLEVVPILAYVPTWLKGDPNWVSVYIEKYIKPVVGRYAAGVKHWEIWNEPDEITEGVLDGTANNYFNLVTQVAPIIRSIDADARIVSAATANITADNFDKWNWTNALIDFGLANYVDVLNIHYYANLEFELQTQGGALVSKWGKALWVTETGRRGQSKQLKYFDDNMRFLDKNLNPERIYWYTYIEGAITNETKPADSTYGLVTYQGGVRQESDLYQHLKSR